MYFLVTALALYECRTLYLILSPMSPLRDMYKFTLKGLGNYMYYNPNYPCVKLNAEDFDVLKTFGYVCN